MIAQRPPEVGNHKEPKQSVMIFGSMTQTKAVFLKSPVSRNVADAVRRSRFRREYPGSGNALFIAGIKLRDHHVF